MTLVDGHAPTLTDGTYPGATIRSGEIIIYKLYGDPNDLQPTGWDVPQRLAYLIAHELGHALGLGDSDCIGDVMNVNADPYSAAVTQADCAEADDLNQTADELYGCQPNDPGCEYSPILISFNGDGYRLTSVEDGVRFDINGDGTANRIAWTRANGEDAFLWLDRNGDGVVNGGNELFGNATVLRNGHVANNGFEALREWDSNGDGVIDSSDSVWESLMLWTDRNHNGISEPDEIRPLADSGVTAISLDYRRTNRRDSFGNRYRWSSYVLRVGKNGKTYKEQIYDVVFSH